jgi:Tfp pilus assembly protein PilO
MAREERRMTFIVVPHGGGDLSTRSFEISYGRLRAATIVLVLAIVAWLAMAFSWGYLAAQAARVGPLTAEVRRLEREQHRVAQLASALQRLERQYQQMREMLGAGEQADSTTLWIPPAP